MSFDLTTAALDYRADRRKKLERDNKYVEMKSLPFQKTKG